MNEFDYNDLNDKKETYESKFDDNLMINSENENCQKMNSNFEVPAECVNNSVNDESIINENSADESVSVNETTDTSDFKSNFEHFNNGFTHNISPVSSDGFVNDNKLYFDGKHHIDILETKTKPKRKKRYISVSAAVVALILTFVFSVGGSVFIAEKGYFDSILGSSGKEKFSYAESSNPVYTVDDNINHSGDIKGEKVNNNKLEGDVLSTPEIVDKVGPAVVGIINKTTYGNAYGYYGFFGNLDDEIEQSSGSGVIISSDGYIVTNNHVIDKATKIIVILNNGQEYEAKFIGGDSSTDLAIIKIEAQNLTFAQMGVSSNLRVGETAIAIGNPLGQEFAGTTTQGIISGLNRSVTIDNKTMNLIQTDAAINPGNSGGALVNDRGLLIGINTAKISSNTLEGLGFAIPVDEAKPIIEDLIKNGYVTGRPVIGIGGRAVTKEDAEAYNLKVGVYVSTLTPNGPAHVAGINIGDIIVECDGEPIETVDDINNLKKKKSPGDTIKLKIYRRGEYVNIDLILGEEMPGN